MATLKIEQFSTEPKVIKKEEKGKDRVPCEVATTLIIQNKKL